MQSPGWAELDANGITIALHAAGPLVVIHPF